MTKATKAIRCQRCHKCMRRDDSRKWSEMLSFPSLDVVGHRCPDCIAEALGAT